MGTADAAGAAVTDGGDNVQGYAWEQAYDKSWEGLQEDAQGVLRGKYGRSGLSHRIKRKQQGSITESVHRGLIRYVYVILDLSRAMDEIDLRPSRIAVALQGLHEFIRAFYDENPLSNLGVIVTRDGSASRLSPLSGSPMTHLRALNGLETGGEMSLQNALTLAHGSLKTIPSYGTKECIIVMSSISSTDPGDVFPAIERMETASIRCSVVSLSAELHICKILVEKTNGMYAVAKNKTHFIDLLLQCVSPPPKESDGGANAMFTTFVAMGFPSQSHSDSTSTLPTPLLSKLKRPGSQTQRAVLCSDSREISFSAFFCPQCRSACSEVPSTCRICNLPLIAAPHLARSYHHLFPVPLYIDVEQGVLATELDTIADNERHSRSRCFACARMLLPDPNDGMPYMEEQVVASECPSCNKLFCLQCDLFVHDTLHNCPGCLQTQPQVPDDDNNSGTNVGGQPPQPAGPPPVQPSGPPPVLPSGPPPAQPPGPPPAQPSAPPPAQPSAPPPALPPPTQ